MNGIEYLDENLIELVKSKVSEKRFIHIMNVVEMSKKICDVYNIDLKKVLLGALLHDITKEDEKVNALELIKSITNDKFIIEHKNLWHAYTGAYYVEHELNIMDKEILEAIKYHTIGNKNMSDVAKVVFVADVIEVGRTNETSRKLREEVQKEKITLDYLLKESCQRKIDYLKKQNINYHNNLLELIDVL